MLHCTVNDAALYTHGLQDPNIKNVTALAMDPGGLPDSRVMNTGVPLAWWILMKGVLKPLQPVLKYVIPDLRPAKVAAVDLIELSVGKSHAGASGYYTMARAEATSPDSSDEEKQRALWVKSLEWAGITEEKTDLKALL